MTRTPLNRPSHLSRFLRVRSTWHLICFILTLSSTLNRVELFAASPSASSSPSASQTLTFEQDVRPILKAHCFHCHGEDGETKGRLDVRLTRFLLQGGKSGAAIIPGNPADSHLVHLIRSGEMPEGNGKLSPAEIATIKSWIAQGARTEHPEPEQLGPEHAFTHQERQWWAFQPITRPSPPLLPTSSIAHNPIDLFIQHRLQQENLSPSPEASPQTLLRRIAFTLTGLPPSPDELQHLQDHPPADTNLYIAQLIDRLLLSPHYGERMARHWLDIAGYADSDGYTDKDPERQHSWKYRDYVIEAFNRDLLFHQFIREQLAGDEIAQLEKLSPDSDSAAERQRYSTLLRATGFLRMAPDGTGIQNDLTTRNDNLADTIKILSTTLYGMTIGCAQCHDHRYDPITHEDYHRLRAIFEPALNPNAWLTPAARLVSITSKEQKLAADRIEAEAKKIDAERLRLQEQFITEVLEKEVTKAAEADRKTLHEAYRTSVKERSPAQTALLKKYPRVNQLSAGSLYLYDTTYKTKHATTLKDLTAKAAAIRATKPEADIVHALTEKPGPPPTTHILHRGQPDQPKAAVTPADLAILATHRQIDIPENNPALPTTGRRLAFAHSITDGNHPLLARVIVNRIWLHHFGKGIVPSVADFGALGEKPSHPELLDWLASEFMANNWSIKHLHRLILSSHTYRQSSLRQPQANEADPDNILLSRANLKRIEAETLRDTLLSISGQLNPKLGGPAIPVSYNESGQVIIANDSTDSAGRPTNKITPLNGEEYRRSIYIQARRSRPFEMFATFDAPAMTEANCELRPITTVSPQSLLLMNNLYMREYAQFTAQRLQRDHSDPTNRITTLFHITFNRSPSQSEIDQARHFLQDQTAHYTSHPAPLETVINSPIKENAPADLLALAALCHALLSSNEMLYID